MASSSIRRRAATVSSPTTRVRWRRLWARSRNACKCAQLRPFPVQKSTQKFSFVCRARAIPPWSSKFSFKEELLFFFRRAEKLMGTSPASSGSSGRARKQKDVVGRRASRGGPTRSVLLVSVEERRRVARMFSSFFFLSFVLPFLSFVLDSVPDGTKSIR